MALTRGKTSNPIFLAGQASELPRNVLPREIDIYNYLKFLQIQRSSHSVPNIANSIAKEVVEIWSGKGNLPTISVKAVSKEVIGIHKRGKAFLKSLLKKN